MIPKAKRWESTAYLGFIRSKPCLRCGSTGRTVAHHWAPTGVGGKGTGKKHSDWATLPLCSVCHQEWHDLAEIAGWDTARCKEEFTISLLRLMGSWIEST